MSHRPRWFIVTMICLLLWSVMGVVAFASHVMVGAKLASERGAWDLAFYLGLPFWFAWDYGIATLGALAGAAALLMRSRWAAPLYIVSLAAVLIQFGYVFLGTDLLAQKGAASTIPFPVFIVFMAGLQIVVARVAAQRDWVA